MKPLDVDHERARIDTATRHFIATGDIQPIQKLIVEWADAFAIQSPGQASPGPGRDAVGQDERSVSPRCADETVAQHVDSQGDKASSR